jgi:TonB family protein
MTSSSRRAMPWIVSLAAHLVLLLIVAILLAVPRREPLAPQVVITLVGAPGVGRGALTAGSPQTSGGFFPRPPRGEIVPSDAPARGRTAPAGDAANAPATPVSAVDTPRVPPAADVLQDTAAGAEQAAGSSAAGTAEAAGSPSGTQLDWEGLPRKLIRRRTPEFPAVLSAMGQEIEGEARISVAPSGVVTRVEITGSSGYIEIDASVEAALRDYLFSRVDGRAETVGTVHFRFRLEKQD